MISFKYSEHFKDILFLSWHSKKNWDNHRVTFFFKQKFFNIYNLEVN